MTIPLQLTLVRIALTFVVMGLVFTSGAAAKAAALVLFGVAAMTDWLDGFLARRWNQTTPLGILLDPIADKILVLGLLLAFVQLELVRAWMVLVILLRELMITGVRLYAAGQRIVIPAAREGKRKAVSQMVAVVLVLVLLLVRDVLPARVVADFEAPMQQLILAAMWITVLLTIISGGSFFWRNRSVLFHAGTR